MYVNAETGRAKVPMLAFKSMSEELDAICSWIKIEK